MCAIFVIPSSCSAALLAGRLQVAVLLFFLSLLFKLLNVLANVAIEYSVTKTAVHREEKKKKRDSQVRIASMLICIYVVGLHIIKATHLIYNGSPADTV